MNEISDPIRNEPPKRPRGVDTLPAGDAVDLRRSGLAGLRVLLDRFLGALDGFGPDAAATVDAQLEELKEYHAEVTRLLLQVVVHDGRRPERRQARALALRLLGHLHIGEALPTLAALLEARHEPPTQRMAAADAMGLLRDEKAEACLLRHLGDPDPRIRRAVVVALGHCGTPRALEALQKEAPAEHRPLLQKALVGAVEALEARHGGASGLAGRFKEKPRPSSHTEEVGLQPGR